MRGGAGGLWPELAPDHREASHPSIESEIAKERARSHSYGGRTVFGWTRPPMRGLAARPKA